MKVLYIAGWGRSGTTILDNVLGQVDGFTSTGELHLIWQRGLVDGRLCGCGQPLRECAVWRDAFEVGFGGVDQVDAQRAIALQGQLHTRHAARVYRAQQAGQVPARYHYADYLRRLYAGIAEATSARVIVDSSKFPTDGIVAAGLANCDVYVAHLVRDPRAVAYSWQRKKLSPGKSSGGGLLTRVGMARSTAVWLGYNEVIARYLRGAVGNERYLLVNYERMATEPSQVVNDLIELVAEHPAHRPAFDGNAVDLGVSHTASGNPNRFSVGRIDIRLDDEWQHKMSPWRKRAVGLLAAPRLRAFGYR